MRACYCPGMPRSRRRGSKRSSRTVCLTFRFAWHPHRYVRKRRVNVLAQELEEAVRIACTREAELVRCDGGAATSCLHAGLTS